MLIDHRVVPGPEYRLAADLAGFCEQALARGLDGLGLTLRWAPFSRHPSVLEARYLEMLEAKALYAGALDVRVGLEVDLVREWMDETLDRVDGLDLDFISGNVTGTRRMMVDLPSLGSDRSAVLGELRDLQDAATHRMLGPDRGDAADARASSLRRVSSEPWPSLAPGTGLVLPALELTVADVIEIDRLGIDLAMLLDGWTGRLVVSTGAAQPGGVGNDLARAVALVRRFRGEDRAEDFEFFPRSAVSAGSTRLAH